MCEIMWQARLGEATEPLDLGAGMLTLDDMLAPLNAFGSSNDEPLDLGTGLLSLDAMGCVLPCYGPACLPSTVLMA